VNQAELPTFGEVKAIRGTLLGAARLSNIVEPGAATSAWHESECYGWQLDNRIAFTPRPLSGQLSLFNVQVTDEELGALRSAGLLPLP
jgi:hypothetical protein